MCKLVSFICYDLSFANAAFRVCAVYKRALNAAPVMFKYKIVVYVALSWRNLGCKPAILSKNDAA